MKTFILALAVAASAGLVAPTGPRAQDAGSPAGTETVVVPETPPEDTVTGDESAVGGFTVLRGDVDLSGFMWLALPQVNYSDTPDDPRYAEQLRLLALRPADLAARDVVVIADTDPSALTSLRRQLRPRGFSVVLVDKDGDIELRRPAPTDVRVISNTIDRTPLRRQEIRDAKRDMEG